MRGESATGEHEIRTLTNKKSAVQTPLSMKRLPAFIHPLTGSVLLNDWPNFLLGSKYDIRPYGREGVGAC